jgi:hypothetical protein
MAVERQRPADVRAWLARRPSLQEMRTAYPDEWQAVQRELGEVVASGDPEDLKAYVLRTSRGGGSGSEVRRAMTTEALRKLCVAAATGVRSGRVRFNLLNGWLAQKLLFRGRGLERKPVSLAWFSVIWPLLSQRRFLMPLVEPKGIYCFYSRRLVRELAAMIGDRRTLEIAAGDGTLSRFLAGEGVDVTATDDFSWGHSIDFPDDVVRQDAVSALREREPEVVIVSWPPAGNRFEEHVFRTPSVDLYVVIASEHAFASGNWSAYEAQTEFDFARDDTLSRLVLPPELEAAVYVFRRRSPAR